VITIDGKFEDWIGVTTTSDLIESAQFNPNVDIVEYRVDDRYSDLSFYLKVEGDMLAGEPGGGRHVDSAYIFIDTDQSPDTGFYIKGIGADFTIEVYGWDQEVMGSTLYRYEEQEQDWNYMIFVTHLASAVSTSELETKVPFSALYIEGQNSFDVLFYMQSWDRFEDFSDTIISNDIGVLVVNQQGVGKDMISGNGNKMLKLELQAVARDITVNEIIATRTGTGSDSDIVRIRLEDVNQNSIATGSLSNGLLTFRPEIKINEGQSQTLYVVVDISNTAEIERSIGFRIENNHDVDTDYGTVFIKNIEPDDGFYDRSYVLSMPDDIVIDGAFSDWEEKVIKNDTSKDVMRKDLDILNYGVSNTEDGPAFYLRVDDEMCGGVAVPYWNNEAKREPIIPTEPTGESPGPPPFWPKSGEDIVYILIDTDFDSGYLSKLPIRPNYMIEIKGRNNVVLNRTFYEWSGSWPGQWKWTELGFVDVALDTIRMEVALNWDDIGLDPDSQSFEVYFYTTDWEEREIDYSDLEGPVRGTRAATLAEIATGIGSSDYDSFGWNVSYAGDVNNDGYPDIIVGAPFYNYLNWYDTNWSYRKKLTFDNSDQSEDLVSFPVLINLSASNIDYSKLKSDGSDLRFIDDDGNTVLNYHIEEWDDSGYSYVWVNVSRITGTSSSDHIYMYYNNSAASDIQDISGTYNSNYVGIWHLNETTGTHYDATSNDYDGTAYGGVSQDKTGHIDGADEFDGSNDYIDIDPFSIINYTINFWFNGNGTIIGYENVTMNTSVDLDSESADTTIIGESGQDKSGIAVSSGDINGDGVNDTVIGAYGRVFIIYGYADRTDPDTHDLDSTPANITIKGSANDKFGLAVASGDVNNDGYDDVIIGAQEADPTGGMDAGETYIVYGADYTSGSTIDLNSATANITISGDDASDYSGYAVSSGDINNDNYEDVIIGAYGADPAGGSSAGETYVIYGGDWASGTTIDLNSISANITIYGDDVDDDSGHAVSSGDINNDNYDDVIIGAWEADPAGGSRAGETYVIYGGDWASGSTIDLNSVSANITIYGDDEDDYSGCAVSSGDINNDNYDDVIIGADRADPAGGSGAGETYVIYGGDWASGSTIDLNSVSANITIYGDDANDFSGCSVSSGDINNDGYDDVIIGANWASPAGGSYAGETYVIYGGDWISGSTIDLNSVSANITIYGDDYSDYSGWAVSSGDINNDGYNDVIIGAPYAIPAGGYLTGETYVTYGLDYLSGTTIDLSSESANITIYGDDNRSTFGYKVSSGDINNDGYIDLIIGTDSPLGVNDAGVTYVFYGQGSLSSIIDLSFESANITIYGDDLGDCSGQAVSSGDINNDGYDDVIIGAYFASPSGRGGAGETYVIYGGEIASGTIIDLNSESADITIGGDDNGDNSGISVSSGDINNDGYDDVIIGAEDADPAGGSRAGETYVIYGGDWASGSTIDLSSVSANITIYGDDADDESGCAVSSGDVNNDGYDDVIIAAYKADPAGGSLAGETYVIYGGDWVSGSTIDLNSVSANITIYGDDGSDYSGSALSSGDINNDGYDDVIIGAPYADPAGGGSAGETYVIYGGNWASGSTIDLNSASANITIYGDDLGDLSGWAVSSGDINDDGYDDVIIGASGADPAGGVDAGETYVIYGGDWASGSTIDLNSVSANITIYGDDADDVSGSAVSSGDYNGDGYVDVIIGAYEGDYNSRFDCGKVYVVNPISSGEIVKVETFDSRIRSVFAPDGNPSSVISSTLDTTEWHSATVTKGSDLRLYIDGSLVSTSSVDSGSLSEALNFTMGVLNRNGTLRYYFDGLIDEVKISNTARSADWVNAQHLSMNNTFITYGNEEPINWWDYDWQYRRQLTFDNSGQSEAMVNFPVLVNLSSSNFDYSKAKSDGTDLRFIDPDGSTELKYHIEEWNSSGYSYVWVNVTNIAGSSYTDFVHMYYGNSEASDGQDIEGTYDINFSAVWHLNETTGTHFDATSNDNDGTQQNGVTQDSSGKIDGADYFDGTNAEYISVSDSSSLDPPNDMTVEAWVKVDDLSSTTGSNQVFLYKIDTGPPYMDYELMLGTDDYFFFGFFNSGGTDYWSWYTGSVSVDTWYYIVGMRDGSNMRFYVNGESTDCGGDSDATGTLNDGDGALRIGTEWGKYHINGSMDEVRFSDSTRSADWIKAQYLSMNNGFITYGSEQIQSNAELTDAGAAYIFFGYPGISSNDINASNANVTINGSNVGDYFGWDVRDAGNVNGDSYDDIIIGAPGYGTDKGRAYIFYGRATGSWSSVDDADTDADVIITGEMDYDRFGQSVSGAGDVDNSNNDDLIVGAPNADGFWDTSWNYRKKLTFSNGDQTENLENFPVMVNLSSSNFAYSKANSNGSDLRFVDADGTTELDYHFEDWDTSGYSYIWVEVPQIDGESTTDYIWMYYNNTAAPDDQDITGTYDTNFSGVWHLNETSGTHYDATSNDNDGTVSGGVSQDETGVVDGSDEFDGDADYINCGTSDSLNMTTQITLEAWVKSNGIDFTDLDLSIIYKYDASDRSYALTFNDDAGDGDDWDFSVSSDGSSQSAQLHVSNGVINNAWQYMAATWDGSDLRLYQNGVEIGTSVSFSGPLYQSATELWIGDGNLYGSMEGWLDEVRISNKGRSADWVAAQYLSMTYDFITFGSEEALSDSQGFGKAYIFYGDGSIPTSAANADVNYTGEGVGDQFGFSVSDAGDVNNDGKDDVIIGAPYNDDSGTDAGKAYIYIGDLTGTSDLADSVTITYGTVSAGSYTDTQATGGNSHDIDEENINTVNPYTETVDSGDETISEGVNEAGSDYTDTQSDNNVYQEISELYTGVDSTVYVATNVTDNGTITNFNNAKSASDGGANATLEEELTSWYDSGMSEITIDDAVDDATDEYNPSPGAVFINETDGYVFFIDDAAGANNRQVSYRKTTDGGVTWGSEVSISSDLDYHNVAVWYDQWTPGNTETKIHIVAIGDDNDNVEYRWLDTTDDSLRSSWVTVGDMGAFMPPDGGVSITNSTDGNLFALGFGTTPGLFKSTDNETIMPSSYRYLMGIFSVFIMMPALIGPDPLFMMKVQIPGPDLLPV
jgi:hypothetical protein